MSEQPQSGPGAALQAGREARGISREDVARAMHLPVGFVAGVEENAFSQLPPPTFTRGYIRSYAKLLGIDSDVLIEQYGEAIRDEGDAQLVVAVSRRPLREFPQRRPALIFGGAVLAVVLAVASILWWAWPQEDAAPPQQTGLEGSRPDPATPLAQGEAGAGAEDDAASANAAPARDERRSVGTAPAVDTSEEVPERAAGPTPEVAERPSRAADETPSDEAPVERNVPDTAVGDVTGGADDVDVPDDVDSPDVEEDPEPAPVAAEPAGADVLRFSFDEDCWVEVYDGDGNVLHMDMSLAGESLSVRGTAPFSVRLGNAQGTVLTFNGASVELAPHTRANVANLVLGA